MLWEEKLFVTWQDNAKRYFLSNSFYISKKSLGLKIVLIENKKNVTRGGGGLE
jgi:hypothetical protein